MVLVLCVASSIGQLGRRYADAGGLYAYISRALGPRVGALVGWLNLFFQPFFAVLLFLVMANIVQSTLETKAHVHVPAGWIILAIAAVVYLITVAGVKASTEVGVFLGVFELVAFLALAIWLIVDAGSANTIHVLDPSHSAHSGFTGVWKGSVFAVLAFVGFEGAAVLGEESENPRRIIPRSVVLAALIVGGFLIVTSYAAVVGWGPTKLGNYATNSNPWEVLGTRAWGAGWVIIFIALVNSAAANATAGVISCSRVLYALGKGGLLPSRIASTHAKHKTPHIAIAANVIFATLVALLASAKWGPLTAFAVTATAFVVLVIVCYMVACVACMVEYGTRRREEWNAFIHAVIPLVGIVVMGFALYYTYIPLSPYPIRDALWFSPAWILLGVIVVAVAWRWRPDMVRTAQAVLSEQSSDGEPPAQPSVVSAGAG
jgi:amino acid transporter